MSHMPSIVGRARDSAETTPTSTPTVHQELQRLLFQFLNYVNARLPGLKRPTPGRLQAFFEQYDLYSPAATLNKLPPIIERQAGNTQVCIRLLRQFGQNTTSRSEFWYAIILLPDGGYDVFTNTELSMYFEHASTVPTSNKPPHLSAKEPPLTRTEHRVARPLVESNPERRQRRHLQRITHDLPPDIADRLRAHILSQLTKEARDSAS